jgi:MoaA/NifB/PqqE/SkfB family radical SAM enzyme
MSTQINQAFCILPFIHLHINENDQVKPCCYASALKQYDNTFDFETDQDLNKIRQSMLEGKKVKNCANCYKIDQLGGTSYRVRDTQEWMTRLNFTDYQKIIPKLQYYDIRNDNLCNLSCRICHPGASTQIAKEHKKLGWVIQENTRQSKMSDIINYDTVSKVYVAGGEPTVMPEFKKFLEKAIKEQRTDIELQILTNGTNCNADYFDLIKHFSNVSVTISIDGYDQVNRYIRWPSHWETIVENIHKWYTITSAVSFAIAVSIWNIVRLRELIDFLDQTFSVPVILMNPAAPILANDERINISPFNFPNKELVLKHLDDIKNTQSYIQEEYFQNQVKMLINGVTNNQTNIDELRSFFKYNDALDASRNIHLRDYIPELEQCQTYLTTQI